MNRKKQGGVEGELGLVRRESQDQVTVSPMEMFHNDSIMGIQRTKHVLRH